MPWERLVLKYEKENQALVLLEKYAEKLSKPTGMLDDGFGLLSASPLRSDWTDAEYDELRRHYKRVCK